MASNQDTKANHTSKIHHTIAHSTGTLVTKESQLLAKIIKHVYWNDPDEIMFTATLHIAKGVKDNSNKPSLSFSLVCFAVFKSGCVITDTRYSHDELMRRAPHFFSMSPKKIGRYKLTSVKPCEKQTAITFADADEELIFFLPTRDYTLAD